MPLLEIRELRKSYRITPERKQHVLTDASFTLDRGELVAIAGESGSGKSTLLNIIGGLDRDYEGSVIIDGTDLSGYGEKELDDHRKLKVGFVFQSFNLIPTFTVKENIMTAAKMTDMPKKEMQARADSLITRLGLTGLEDKRPAFLSGGEKQRTAIARALMNDPDMILADEPTGALDRQNAMKLMDMLRAISKDGRLVVVVTHSAMVAAECDRVIRLEYGHINETVHIQDEQDPVEPYERYRPKKLGMIPAFSAACRNIVKNRTRNILVAIGASVGIFAVVLMLFLSGGIQKYITGEMYSANDPLLIEVTKAGIRPGGMNMRREINNILQGGTFDRDELAALTEISGVAGIEKGSMLSGGITYIIGEAEGGISVISTMYSSYRPALSDGGYPLSGQVLLSRALAESIAGESAFADIIGDDITIMASTGSSGAVIMELEISGIAESGDGLFSRYNTAVVTYDYLDNIFNTQGGAETNVVYLYAENTGAVESIKQAVSGMGYTANRQEASLQRIIEFINIVTIGLTGIASISLIVSGIMILVVLYISVVERTKEIGTLRAIGARKNDIKIMFTAEGIILGFSGGVIGVLSAVLFGSIFNFIMVRLYGIGLVNIDPMQMMAGIALSIFVSMTAGFVPAAKAARLDPVEALRYE